MYFFYFDKISKAVRHRYRKNQEIPIRQLNVLTDTLMYSKMYLLIVNRLIDLADACWCVERGHRDYIELERIGLLLPFYRFTNTNFLPTPSSLIYHLFGTILTITITIGDIIIIFSLRQLIIILHTNSNSPQGVLSN